MFGVEGNLSREKIPLFFARYNNQPFYIIGNGTKSKFRRLLVKTSHCPENLRKIGIK